MTLARETDGYESEEIINSDSSLDLTDYLIPSQRLLPFSEPVQRISRPLLRREDVTPRRSSVMQLQSHSAREATTAKTSRQIPGVVTIFTFALYLFSSLNNCFIIIYFKEYPFVCSLMPTPTRKMMTREMKALKCKPSA